MSVLNIVIDHVEFFPSDLIEFQGYAFTTSLVMHAVTMDTLGLAENNWLGHNYLWCKG